MSRWWVENKFVPVNMMSEAFFLKLVFCWIIAVHSKILDFIFHFAIYGNYQTISRGFWYCNILMFSCTDFYHIYLSCLIKYSIVIFSDALTLGSVWGDRVSRALLEGGGDDWLLHSLALQYWRLMGNPQQAIHCARRALYLVPRWVMGHISNRADTVPGGLYTSCWSGSWGISLPGKTLHQEGPMGPSLGQRC